MNDDKWMDYISEVDSVFATILTINVVFREIPRITAHNFPTGLRYFFGHKDNFHINSYIFLLWPMIHSIKLNYKIIENKY